MFARKPFAPPVYDERDLDSEPDDDSTHSSEAENSQAKNSARPTGGGTPAKTPGGSIRRSFSWGKKKKRAALRGAEPTERFMHEYREVAIDRQQADCELGLERHAVTCEIIVSYVGETVSEYISVGDRVCTIQGIELDELPEKHGDAIDVLEAARVILGGPAETVDLTIEKNVIRTEVLKRHAALRGTSLDRLGMEMCPIGDKILVTDITGIAAKSGRIAVGDRLIGVNGTRIGKDLDLAVQLIGEDASQVELELAYHYVAPTDHEFDPSSGTFVASEKPSASSKGLNAVRRSLSFGKRKKKLNTPKPKTRVTTHEEMAQAVEASWEAIDPLYEEPRLITIVKDEMGKMGVTFRAHAVTGELIIAVCGTDGPASRAGVEVGDHVVAINGMIVDFYGNQAVDAAREQLEAAAHQTSVSMLVQTRVRVESCPFGAEVLGGPRDKLGLSFHSCEGDNFVRVTKITGAAERCGRFALGDRIIAMNGIRVNHAETLSEHIATACRTLDEVEFEVALGYAAAEGLWYGKEDEHTPAEGAAEGGGGSIVKKVKRSFSFGKKPRH